jgi:hypothetical protein
VRYDGLRLELCFDITEGVCIIEPEYVNFQKLDASYNPYVAMVPPKSDNGIRRFIVSDPRRHKKGFTVYKVTSIVSSSIP